jgi:hypothetical protein
MRLIFYTFLANCFVFVSSNFHAQSWDLTGSFYSGSDGSSKRLIYDTLRGMPVRDPASNSINRYSNNWGEYAKNFKNHQPNLFEYDENLIFENGSEFVFFSKTSSKIRITTLDGSILVENHIRISKPIIWNRNDILIIKDKNDFEFYIITETIFNFYIYNLNVRTGKTKLLKATKDVWKNPNFRIDNGQLHYQKNKAGKLENYTLDLKN